MKSGFLDKLIDRLDKLDAGSLQTHFLRLANEKGLLETIFHAIQEGILVLDGKGRLTYANRAAEKMLGFTMPNAAGTQIAKYLPDIEWDLVLSLDSGEWSRLVSREMEITHPQHRFVTFYVVPLAATPAKEAGAVVILRDVTRERENEAHTIESEKLNALTLLAAGVAHEIGNPLNSLTIHLQLLAREMNHLPEAERKSLTELLDISRREVQRLDQIITQFLRAVRPTQPGFESASLKDVVDSTIEFLQHEIKDRDILIEIEAPSDLPTAYIDKQQIRQAFFNIIRNAMQAMPQGGILKITLSSTDRFVSAAFKDTGSGITADDLGNIFEPYYTTKSEGSGLGLMIVQRIIRDHGGEIEVDSAPRAGTTFTIFLPRDERRVRLLQAAKATHIGDAKPPPDTA